MSAIKDAYEASGNCVVRSVFSPADANTLRVGIASAFTQMLGSPEPKNGPNTLHFSHLFHTQNAWMRRLLFWAFQTFTQSAAYRTYEELYGPRIVFPLLKCIARYQRPDHLASHLPYHQDLDPTKDAHMMNTWVPLDRCGDVAPGLEAINVKVEELRPEIFLSETRDKVGEDKWHRHNDFVTGKYGNYSLTRPIFEPGDGLLFDHFTMHRTYTDDGMTKGRMSVEFRAADAERYFAAYGNVDAMLAWRIDGEVRLFCTNWDPESVVWETKTERFIRLLRETKHVVWRH